MLDRYKRDINYLRISVTDRCNLRCTYCMPEHGIKLLKHNDILSLEEITEIARVAIKSGINKIRITGGEPLIRKGIVSLVSNLWGIEGVKDLAMTTNGVLLHDFALMLKEAGLQRINISLDTVNPKTYKKITRGGEISKVLKGIETAKKVGLEPIKVNCVVMNSSQEKDAVEVKEFCKQNDLMVRFIHQMNLATGEFSVVEGGDGGNCQRCNRLRLTANGQLKPCLFSDLGYDVRKLGAEEALKLALENKPKSGSYNHSGDFYNIGG